jgi:hypothetical protein
MPHSFLPPRWIIWSLLTSTFLTHAMQRKAPPPSCRIQQIIRNLLLLVTEEQHAYAFLSSVKTSEICIDMQPEESSILPTMDAYIARHITPGHRRKKRHEYTEENFRHHCTVSISRTLALMHAARAVADSPLSHVVQLIHNPWPLKAIDHRIKELFNSVASPDFYEYDPHTTAYLKRNFVALIKEYRNQVRLPILWGLARGRYAKALPFEIIQKVLRYLPLHFFSE